MKARGPLLVAALQPVWLSLLLASAPAGPALAWAWSEVRFWYLERTHGPLYHLVYPDGTRTASVCWPQGGGILFDCDADLPLVVPPPPPNVYEP